MQSFSVDLDDYVRRSSLEPEIARCQEATRQVALRYGFAGKSLVSIGAGMAYEEIGMLRAGVARVVAYDIDEHGGLTGLLPTIRPSTRSVPELTFHLGDFTQPSAQSNERYDLLYISGFTPDEMRRRRRSRPVRGLFRLLRATAPIIGRALLRVTDEAWPPGLNPLHACVERAVRELLKPGGWLVIQSYACGIEAPRNPRFVRAMQRAMDRLDVELVEGHCLCAAPAASLWAGVRREVGEEIASLSRRPAMTRFHGRSELSARGAIRFYAHPELAAAELQGESASRAA